MSTPVKAPAPRTDTEPRAPVARPTLRELALYFLRVGSSGFGGPIALVGYMQRDLVEQRGWFTEQEYRQGLALAQTMPGPLAAQLAMWFGYLLAGALGAAAVALPFVLPPCLLVTAVAVLYTKYERLAAVHEIRPRGARDHRDRLLQARAHHEQDRPAAVGDRRRRLRSHSDRQDRDRVAVPRRRRVRRPLLRRRSAPLASVLGRQLLARRIGRCGQGVRVDGERRVTWVDGAVLREGQRVHVRVRARDRAVPAPGARPRSPLAHRAAVRRRRRDGPDQPAARS